jgi:hypothetical protein
LRRSNPNPATRPSSRNVSPKNCSPQKPLPGKLVLMPCCGSVIIDRRWEPNATAPLRHSTNQIGPVILKCVIPERDRVSMAGVSSHTVWSPTQTMSGKQTDEPYVQLGLDVHNAPLPFPSPLRLQGVPPLRCHRRHPPARAAIRPTTPGRASRQDGARPTLPLQHCPA